MKIIKVDFWPVTMKLAEPYTIAYQTIESTTNIFLRLETDTKVVGYGCAAPDNDVTGETPEDVLQSLKDIVIDRLKGLDPLRRTMILESLKADLETKPSTLAAVDMALYDIFGKACHVSVWKMLGGFRDSIMTSITIGILTEEETIRRARDWVAQGFKCIKLKGGKDVESDILRTLMVREAVGESIGLRFDANQGYNLKQAVHYVEETRKAHIQLIEQPTPRGEIEMLGRITSNVHIPVMADESLLTLHDAFHLAQRNLADMVNIKLMKVGGISEALHINSVAKAAKLRAMVGCTDESALGIAAGLHFALARPNVHFADLDGHIGLADDPAAGSVIIRDGILYSNDKPGLGCTFIE